MELQLCYIKSVGSNHRNENIYEFIFTDNLEDVEGDDWDSIPASNNPEPPYTEFIKKVGVLISDRKLELIQESDSFTYWSAIDGIVSLAWENVVEMEEYPDKLLFFKYGETVQEVEDKLYEFDLVLNYEQTYQKL